METPGTFPESAAEDSSFRMIDVSGKNETRRRAVAQGRIRMARETLVRIRDKTVPKGDVLALAEVAGIMAAKKTAELLPLCHPLALDSVRVVCAIEESENAVQVQCEAITTAKTGVEMEALLGASAALLSIYDLIKGIDPVLQIGDIFLRTKEGGKSGDWVNPLIASGTIACSLQGVRAGVITVSDRCSQGKAEDSSGPHIADTLSAWGAAVEERALLADDRAEIARKVRCLAYEKELDLVVLSGGTGLGPRDVTPEALKDLWTKPVPGIGEMLRSSGAKHKTMAWLSRSEGGLIGRTLVILLPGSLKAVSEGMEVLKDILPHAIHIAKGGAH